MTFNDIFKSSFLENITSVSILDMIIALGYRVQSPIAVRFRRWATPWKATELFPTKKPLRRLSESLKSIVSEKCDS